MKRALSLSKSFLISGYPLGLMILWVLVLLFTLGCDGDSGTGENTTGDINKTDWKYTISNHSGYDITVYHTDRRREDWSGGNSPQNKFNDVLISSKHTETRKLTSMRSSDGRVDIRLVVCEPSTGEGFTSTYKDEPIARMANKDDAYVRYVSGGDERLRLVWVRATDESFLNIYKWIPITYWMRSLDGSLTLAQLAIPGTHDSGAYNGKFKECNCQSSKPSEQLDLGVRSFDLRLQCKNNELYLIHGLCKFDYKHKLRDTLDHFLSFLENHPTEVIMLHIKKEEDPSDCSDFADNTGVALKHLLEQMEGQGLRVMKEYDAFPTLGQAAGQVLVWHEPNIESCCSYPITIDWESETPRQVVRWGVNSTFVVQDAYKNRPSKKWDIVKPLLVEAAAHTDAQRLFYNYTSCVKWPDTPLDGASNINEWLATWLSRNPKGGPLGVIIADYITCTAFLGPYDCLSKRGSELPFMIYSANF